MHATLPWLLLGARLGVAALFAVAAVAKLADPAATRGALQAFGVPAWSARPGALLLPAVELAVAVLLVPGATARVGAIAALALLVVFSAVLARELVRGTAVGCNCFGALSSPRASRALVRNAVLAGAMAAVAVLGHGQAAAVPVAAAAVAAVALAWIAWQLLRRRAELGALERAGQDVPASPALPLAAGDEAPPFALPDVHGSWRTLDDLLVSGRPLLLAFSDPDCAHCDGLPERLATWQAARSGELELALVTRDATGGAGFEPVLTQSEHEVAHLYGAWHVPSALLVAPDGRVARPLAVGERAIEGLLDSETEKAVS